MDVFIIILILAAIVIVSCVRVVPQAEAHVIERIGSYLETWKNGLHFKLPFLDKAVHIGITMPFLAAFSRKL